MARVNSPFGRFKGPSRRHAWRPLHHFGRHLDCRSILATGSQGHRCRHRAIGTRGEKRQYLELVGAEIRCRRKAISTWLPSRRKRDQTPVCSSAASVASNTHRSGTARPSRARRSLSLGISSMANTVWQFERQSFDFAPAAADAPETTSSERETPITPPCRCRPSRNAGLSPPFVASAPQASQSLDCPLQVPAATVNLIRPPLRTPQSFSESIRNTPDRGHSLASKAFDGGGPADAGSPLYFRPQGSLLSYTKYLTFPA
jgi:hypothetical protein